VAPVVKNPPANAGDWGDGDLNSRSGFLQKVLSREVGFLLWEMEWKC